MGLLLFLALFGTPLAEIAIFIQVHDLIGLWPTLLGVILTAMLGTTLLRWQGLSTWKKAQASLDRMEVPINEVFDGLCLLAAGLLLLTPGFMTDAIGFLLFVPAFRAVLRKLAARRIAWRAQASRGGYTFTAGGFEQDDDPRRPGTRPADRQSEPPGVIEGEYETLSDRDDPGRSDATGKDDSPWRKPDGTGSDRNGD